MISLRLNADELRQLRFLAESLHVTESEVLRRLIRIFYPNQKTER